MREDNVIDFYGSQANAAILQLLGTVIKSTCTNWLVKSADGWVPDFQKDPGEWLRDPKLFDEVLTAIIHALIWFKPGASRHDQFLFYHSAAERIINEIRAADPSLPLTKRSTRQHAMAVLKDELGDLARRRHPHDDFLQKEPPIRIAVSNPAKRKHK